MEEQPVAFDPDSHSMKCPKCSGGMIERRLDDVVIDTCTNCGGIWFDQGEMEQLKAIPGSEALDYGDKTVGREMDFEVEDIDCPHCSKKMAKGSDPEQPHIWYEYCQHHGLFLDAGEFKDLKNKDWVDWFRLLNKGLR